MDDDAHPRRPPGLQTVISTGRSALYVAVAALLVLAAVAIVVGTIADIVEGSGDREITDNGLFVLERVLLLFIIAELLYTLQLVDFSGEILVEPFLFIGLIAVVRRVLVLMAEAEGGNRVENTDFLIQIGALGGLALVLSVAIHLLRTSERRAPSSPHDDGGR